MAIIQAPGGGWELLVETLLNKERLAQSKEEINQNRKRFEFEQEQALAARQREQDVIAGASAAAQLFAMQRPEIGAAMDPLPPGAMPSFLENLQGYNMGAAQVTGQELTNVSLGSAARVATGTEAARVEDTNLAPAVTRAELLRIQAETQGINTNNALLELKRVNDPVRVEQAWDMILSGQVTAKQAFDAQGITNTALPDDFKFVPPEAGDAAGAGGEQARRAAAIFNLMKASDLTMQRLASEGVDIGFIGSLNRSASKAWWQATTNAALGEKEQQLINAQKQFADGYRLFISGQQSAVTEAERIMFTISDNPGDAPEVRNQKAFMRALVLNMVEEASAGRVSPLQAATQIYDTAVAQGLPEEQLAVFREQRDDAAIYEVEGGFFGSQNASTQPTTPGTLPDAITRADELLNQIFGPSGR